MGNYIIGIGGTGMRCLESFIHLCATGMMDKEEINILMLDTDYDNGNKSRTRDLLYTYIRLRNVNSDQDNPRCAGPLRDSLFSAKLNLYEFYPHYQGNKSTFTKICDHNGNVSSEVRQNNDDLARLLFDENTRNFDLEHGYRAQTHIGSYLMFHDIVNHVQQVQRGEKEKKDFGLHSFLEKLTNDTEGRVFILGSIFGGTGASSIPVIPRALEAASAELNTGMLLSNLILGTTLLSNYFSFPAPADAQEKRDRIVANAQRFALNSQAALMFYDGDQTVQNTYNRLYLLGWPGDPFDYGKSQSGKETVTGGKDQTNSSHVIELMAAFAAYDFFQEANQGRITDSEHQWLYKSVNTQGNTFLYDFADFSSENGKEQFKEKFTSIYALALMVQNKFEGSSEGLYNSLYKGDTKKTMDDHLGGKSAITSDSFKLLDRYLAYLAFHQEDGHHTPGYLMQIQSSSTQTDFLFNADAYLSDTKSLLNFPWGRLPKKKNERPKSKRGLNLYGSRENFFSPFSRIFKEDESVRPDPSLPTPMDKFINWSYRSMQKLFFPSN